jgi:hypothetical protein
MVIFVPLLVRVETKPFLIRVRVAPGPYGPHGVQHRGIGSQDIRRGGDLAEIDQLGLPVDVEEFACGAHGGDVLLSATPYVLISKFLLPIRSHEAIPGTPRRTQLMNGAHGIPPRRLRSRYRSLSPSHGAMAFRWGGCSMAAQNWVTPSHEFPAMPTAPLHQSNWAACSMISQQSRPETRSTKGPSVHVE